MMFCDYVIVEAQSGKNSLIGTFPSLASPQFPFTTSRFFVHVTISNFIPSEQAINLAVNLKNLHTGAVVASVGMPVTIPFPKDQRLPPNGAHITMNVPFQNITFPSPGAYLCEVLFDGESIGGRSLEVLQIAKPHAPFLPPIAPES